MVWLVWLVVALVALGGEALTTSLIFASLAIAAVIIAPLSLLVALPLQVVVFGALSLALLLGARPVVLRLFPLGSESTSPQLGPLGRRGTVVERVDARGGQIRIDRGEFWTARTLLDGDSLAPGREVEVVRLDGLTALVRSPAYLAPPGGGQIPFGLSPRELEVLRLVALGLTNADIAERLVLSPRTVHHHVGHILDKMGVNGRVEAARLAMERGLTGPGVEGDPEARSE